MCEQKQTPPVKVEVKNLTKKFGDLLVLDNISFNVYQGDLLCVVGPTGCGKTTFLNSLTKIYDITSGQILLDGKPVDPKTNNIAYIFQGDSTMPWLTVEQNVAFGLDIKHVPKARRDELVAKYLDIVGLTKYKSYYPKLWEMTNTTVIFITHNIEEAVYLGNRIMILTNKPTTVKRTVNNTLPRPRDIASPDFVALRTEVTDAIKWW